MSEGAGGGAGAGAGAAGSGGASGANAGGAAAAGASAGGAAAAGAAPQAGGTNGAQAGASGTPAAANAGAGATPAADWTSSFNEETRGYIQNKGWKDQSQVLDSYRNLEKLVGAPQEQILKLPKDGDAPEAWNPIFDRLGRPQTPDGYKLEVPKENGSPEFAKWASQQFHELGLSEKQGRELVNRWNGYQESGRKAVGEAYQAKVTQEQSALKKEWGAAHEQNIGIAQRAAREFGVKPEVISAIEAKVGFHETMKFFHSIGSKMGEASFHAGNPGAANGVMTPQQAKAKIASLKGDPDFVRNYTAGTHSAREQMESLHKMAYPDAS